MLRGMADAHERLQKARAMAGYRTPTDAARAFGWTISTYLGHENGSRGLRPRQAARYAVAFRVSAAWLLTGDGPISSASVLVPVVGYVGAGEVVISVDDHERGAGIDYVALPPDTKNSDGLVALKIRGESMRPLRPGWIVYYRRDRDGVSDDCLNEVCVIRTDQGETFLKELRRGYTAGHFNLHSWAAGTTPMEDVRVEWAARVEAIVCP
jgi:phage repressor protein C with HTH and peptisase S24 domain